MPSTSISGPLPPDVDRGSDFLIVRWLTVSIALLFVSLRFYIRGILRKNLGWDDYTILLATAFAIAQSIITIFQVHSGFGRNIHYLTPVQIHNFGRYTYTSIMLLTPATALVRISVCLFVLRLVPAYQISYRRWLWGLLAICTIVSIADFVAQGLQCVPISGLWDKRIRARCFPATHMTTIAKIQGSSAATTDLLCVIIPMMVFRNLRVSLRDKIPIFVIIGLGFFTVLTAIARTVLVDFTSKNPTWDLIPCAIWACLEINIGIIVASMPVVRQLVIFRKQSSPSHAPEALCNQFNNNNRPPLRPFAKLSDSDRVRLPDDDGSMEITVGLMPMMGDIESCHEPRASPMRLSMVSPPLWTDRKISSAETVEMSRVSPTTTVVERKASAPEAARLSLVAPPRADRKPSSVDKASPRQSKRLSLVSPLSIDRPPFAFFAGRAQPAGRFEETGLRCSRVATPEEIMTLGNPAAMGYSCTIEGGLPKRTSETSPKPSPKPSSTPTWF